MFVKQMWCISSISGQTQIILLVLFHGIIFYTQKIIGIENQTQKDKIIIGFLTYDTI